jgi:hypothetical protein
MDHRTDTVAAQGSVLRGRDWLVMAAAAAVLVGPACWLHERSPRGGASAGARAVSRQAPAKVVEAACARGNAPVPASAAVSLPTSACASAAMQAPLPDVETAAESQREFQPQRKILRAKW